MDKGNYVINQEQYQALKDNGLNFKELSNELLTEDEIKAIGFSEGILLPPEEGGSFANFSSFLYYGGNSKSSAEEQSIETIEILQNWDRLKEENIQLKAGYILLGVNAGTEGISEVGKDTFEHFEMFQIRKKTKSPIKYKNALVDTGNENIYENWLKGTYITDFVKAFPSKNGEELVKKLEKISNTLNYSKEQHEGFYTRFCKLFGRILEEELALLGGETHTIVVMGGKNNVVFKFLEKLGYDKKTDSQVILNPDSKNHKCYNVKNIYHYSYTASQEDLLKQIKEVFNC